VFDPRGGAWMTGRYIPSILAAIGGVIERHMISIGFIAGEGLGLKTDPRALGEPAAAEIPEVAPETAERPRGPACPNCGAYAMRMVEGCMTCADCGHSKCG